MENTFNAHLKVSEALIFFLEPFLYHWTIEEAAESVPGNECSQQVAKIFPEYLWRSPLLERCRQ